MEILVLVNNFLVGCAFTLRTSHVDLDPGIFMVSLDPLVSSLKSPPHPSLHPLLPAPRSLSLHFQKVSLLPKETSPREGPLLSQTTPVRGPLFPQASRPPSTSPKRAPLSPLRTAVSGQLPKQPLFVPTFGRTLRMAQYARSRVLRNPTVGQLVRYFRRSTGWVRWRS